MPDRGRLTPAQRRILGDAVTRGRVIAYAGDRRPIKTLKDAGLLEISRYDAELPEYRATDAGRAVVATGSTFPRNQHNEGEAHA